MASDKSSARPRSRGKDVRTMGNAPLTAYEQAKAEWAERMGSPIVEKNRWFLVSFLLVICLLLGLIGYNQLLPLKTVEPFLFEVDKLTGEVRASAMKAKAYVPQEREIRYFTGQWLRNLVNIDPSTPDALQSAYGQVRGPAIEEFKDYLAKTKVFAEIKSDPSLRRTTEISSLSFIQERVILARIVTTTRSSRFATEQKRYVVNINFELSPPTEEKDLMINPIGYYVTHFDFREELK